MDRDYTFITGGLVDIEETLDHLDVKDFVSEQEGFLEETGEESQLVRAMRRGSDMRVEATSNRGTATAYTFSLLGVTAALEQVDDLCG